MDKYEFKFKYFDDTGELLSGKSLDLAYDIYMQRENKFILKAIQEAQTNGHIDKPRPKLEAAIHRYLDKKEKDSE